MTDLVEAGIVLALQDPPATRVDAQDRGVEARTVEPELPERPWAASLTTARALLPESEPFYDDLPKNERELPDAW